MKRLGTSMMLIAGLGACNAVFGIDEARVDPALDDAGTGAAPGPDAKAPDAGGIDPNVVSCANYCALMQQHCSGTNAQYINEAACLSLCAAMDSGKPGDTTGDSLACRQGYAAQAATVETVFNCRNAGPIGHGQCGSGQCRAFCNYALKLCGTRAYARVQDCMDACKDLRYDETLAVSSDQDRNTLNCRLYHLQAGFAFPNQADVHCPHTAKVSTTCVRPALPR